MSVLLYRYTHKIINALSVRKVFSAVLVRRILNSWLSEAQQHKLTFDKGGKFSAGDSAENLIDGADGEQSPPSRLGIVSES